MAFGPSKDKQFDTELLIIECVGGKEKKSSFNLKKKTENGWEVVDNQRQFSGDFKSLKVMDRFDLSNPKQKVLADQYGQSKKVVLELVDQEAKQTYRFSFNFRMSTRGLINRLLNLKDSKNVQISVSNSKEGGFENFFVKQDSNDVDWKYGLDEFPKARVFIGKGKKEEKDFDDQNQFFIDAIEKFSLDETPVPVQEKTKVSKSKKVVAEDLDEVPF